ncbi:19648_t:CDS:1, partial [Funneliformis geosporum]
FAFQPNDLKVFLDNCRHVGLKKLLVKLVKNNYDDLIDETFSILKEFVVSKKVKYFAYELAYLFQQGNPKYKNLEKLASEVQLFVKMRKYSDLIVTISDYDSTF